MQVSRLLSSPLGRAQHTAALVATYQQLAGCPKPQTETVQELSNRNWGDWEGKFTTEVRCWTRQLLLAVDCLLAHCY